MSETNEQSGQSRQTTRVERKDDFAARRAHLSKLSEAELEERFVRLCRELTEPLVELAETHTSPSIERSVLLRMGFSSLEADAIVKQCAERSLLGKGAGHVVYRVARRHALAVSDAGKRLAAGELWDDIRSIMDDGDGGGER